MTEREESPYVSRQTRQYIEHSAFIDDCVDYLIELGVYSPHEFNYVCSVVKRLVGSRNVDEGNELMEIDAEIFMKQMLREGLEGE